MPQTHTTSDVPTQIFEAFLSALAESGVPPEKISRLRRALLENKDWSEQSLAAAVMSEENVP